MQALEHQEIVPKDGRGGMVSRENYKSVILCIFYITSFIDKNCISPYAI